jgi:hypothetical protein
MKKLLTILISVCVLAVSASAIRPQLGAPRATATAGQVTAMSADVNYDTSLFKAFLLFDELDQSYTAFSYDVAQINGVLPRPIRLGWAGAQKNAETFWTGPSASYNLVEQTRFTLGVCLALNGVKIQSGKFSVDSNMKLIPGVFASFKFN